MPFSIYSIFVLRRRTGSASPSRAAVEPSGDVFRTPRIDSTPSVFLNTTFGSTDLIFFPWVLEPPRVAVCRRRRLPLFLARRLQWRLRPASGWFRHQRGPSRRVLPCPAFPLALQLRSGPSHVHVRDIVRLAGRPAQVPPLAVGDITDGTGPPRLRSAPRRGRPRLLAMRRRRSCFTIRGRFLLQPCCLRPWRPLSRLGLPSPSPLLPTSCRS